VLSQHLQNQNAKVRNEQGAMLIQATRHMPIEDALRAQTLFAIAMYHENEAIRESAYESFLFMLPGEPFLPTHSNTINNVLNTVQTAHSWVAPGVNQLFGDSVENYEHNRGIDIDVLLANTNGFIDSQRDTNDFQMGVLESSWGMGCVWIATFNALKVLDDRHHPAEIIKWFEENGGFLLQGRRGAFTQPAERYLREVAGYNVSTEYLPRFHTIDREIRAGDVAILTYMRSDWTAHAVAIQYMNNG